MKCCSSNEIMKAKCAGDIFTNDKAILRKEYRMYAKKFHPDVYGSNQIMQKIAELYNQALRDIEANRWSETNTIYFRHIDTNKNYRLRFWKEYKFYFGKCYVSPTIVAYFFETKYKKYYDNYLKMYKVIRYKDDKMKDYFSITMPNVIEFGKSNIGYFIILRKEFDVVPLKEVLNLYGGTIDCCHAAWITTRLNNLLCLFTINRIVHNDITIDNLFINPQNHVVYIYGGWWYSVEVNTKLLGMSTDIFNIIPYNIKKTKVADFSIDIGSVKRICRIICNKQIGFKIPIKDWYSCGFNNDAFGNLRKWDTAIENAYGKRRFVNMNVNIARLYER